MGKKFIHPIENLTLATFEGKALTLVSLVDVYLVAESESERIGHLELSVRFRSRCDIDFLQISPGSIIAKKNYPAGFDPKDPAKAIAKNMQLSVQWNGMDGDSQIAIFKVSCGSYTVAGKISLPLSPFLRIRDYDAE